MPDETEDDVPVYFSPEDEGVEVLHFDRKSLLEDEPPREWQPYKPSMTLEEASIEAKKLDESKFKPPSSRKEKKPVKDEKKKPWITANHLRLSLPLAPLPANKEEEDSSEVQQDSQQEKSRKARKKSDLARRSRILLLLGAVNLFAMGFWCGSFLFPNRRVLTSLYELGGSSVSINPAAGNSIADLVEKVHGSVVNVDVRQGYMPPPAGSSVQEPYRPMQGFFNRHNTPRGGYYGGDQSQATGVIVSSDGYILTNSHVLGLNANIRVTMFNNKEYVASVVGRDAYTDLAVLKIDVSNAPVARLGDIKKVRTGDWLVAIGSPIGYDHSVTIGIVSAMNRIVGAFNHHIPLIQTDAAINPGNSGGPLFNMEGKVVGITCAAATRGVEGVAFAIPVDVANEVAKKLITDGKIPRPYLGIKMLDIDPDRKRAQSLPSHPVAVLVASVMRGGPAEVAGVRPGDEIVRFNGHIVRSAEEVRNLIKDKMPGTQVILHLKREGNSDTLEKKFKLLEYPDHF